MQSLRNQSLNRDLDNVRFRPHTSDHEENTETPDHAALQREGLPGGASFVQPEVPEALERGEAERRRAVSDDLDLAPVSGECPSDLELAPVGCDCPDAICACNPATCVRCSHPVHVGVCGGTLFHGNSRSCGSTAPDPDECHVPGCPKCAENIMADATKTREARVTELLAVLSQVERWLAERIPLVPYSGRDVLEDIRKVTVMTPEEKRAVANYCPGCLDRENK